MMQQAITIDEAAALLGVKVIEAFLLQKQIALLNQRVQALAEQLKPKDEEDEESEDAAARGTILKEEANA